MNQLSVMKTSKADKSDNDKPWAGRWNPRHLLRLTFLCTETELILPKHLCVLVANANTENIHFIRQWLFSSNVEHTMHV